MMWLIREFTVDVDVSQLPCYDDDNMFDDVDDNVLTMVSQGVHL